MRFEAQTARDAGRLVGKALQLADGIEDNLVGIRNHLVDLVIGIGNGVGMGFTAEFLAAKTDFIKRGGSGAIHILRHEVEHRPGGEAFQRQQRLGTGFFPHIGNLLHVAKKFCLVDEVIWRLQHLVSHID